MACETCRPAASAVLHKLAACSLTECCLRRNRTFTIVNACNFTTWPSTRSNMPVAGGGFELAPGARVNVSVPDGWIGSWSPRTGCAFDAAGVGSCEVGDCGGFLACDRDTGLMPQNTTTVRAPSKPACCTALACTADGAPVAQAEFSLDAWGGMDCYDVVQTVYTLPMHIQPSDQSCAAAGCLDDLNTHCQTAPVDGRMLTATGKQACASAPQGEQLSSRTV